ncbi:MAG: EF-P beta-lysylation protein EpmB [Acidobacteriota bacterium]
MISRSLDAPNAPPPAWRQELREAIRSVDALCEALALEPDQLDIVDPRITGFPLRVPRSFVARMRPGDPRDPLLRQVLPVARELDHVEGYARDPLGEAEASPVPGLLHKYRGRALLVATGACAVHCRYCFRRHFPYAAHRPANWEPALEHIAADQSLREIILSGGDPLVLDDDHLAEMARAIAKVPHVRRLRVHTRVPVVIPSRVDDRLLDWLCASGGPQPIVVLHINHGNEIDRSVGNAVGRLRARGIPVLNQAVLLSGVNDRLDVLLDLSEKLFEVGVLPYYLHVLDRTDGVAHFDLDPESQIADARALRLLEELRSELPGYLVPRLVREIPGRPSKTPLVSSEAGPPIVIDDAS